MPEVKLILSDNTVVKLELPEPLPPVVKYALIDPPRVTPPSNREQIFGPRPHDIGVREIMLCRDLNSSAVYREDWRS